MRTMRFEVGPENTLGWDREVFVAVSWNEMQAIDFVLNGPVGDTEFAGGAGTVPVIALKAVPDVAALDFFEVLAERGRRRKQRHSLRVREQVPLRLDLMPRIFQRADPAAWVGPFSTNQVIQMGQSVFDFQVGNWMFAADSHAMAGILCTENRLLDETWISRVWSRLIPISSSRR